MAFGETLAQLRSELGITQEELARELFVTRQAVSRWERGDTTPGIDMLKLIAATTGVPVTRLLDMPGSYCESCGMILSDESQHGSNADGSTASEYCKWCFDKGAFTDEMTMDEMIEDCAPRLAKNTGCTLDEAVSLMGAVLPTLNRWAVVRENEERYGAEARSLYGDKAVDEANERLLDMSQREWDSKEELERAIIAQLKAAMETGDTAGLSARVLCSMHERWIRMHWGDAAYSPEVHASLGKGYLADPRFIEYYDSRAGEGATQFLADALQEYCLG
ncbi:MAG: TipAS antibiotic-recognition domain-containing protein [Coriobacteriales bacterium]